MTSPGAFTLLFFVLPLPRLFTLFLLPDWVHLSLFSLLPALVSLPLASVSESFSLDAFVYQLPAKVTEQQLGFANRDLVGTLHSVCISVILIACLLFFFFETKRIALFVSSHTTRVLYECILIILFSISH